MVKFLRYHDADWRGLAVARRNVRVYLADTAEDGRTQYSKHSQRGCPRRILGNAAYGKQQQYGGRAAGRNQYPATRPSPLLLLQHRDDCDDEQGDRHRRKQDRRQAARHHDLQPVVMRAIEIIGGQQLPRLVAPVNLVEAPHPAAPGEGIPGDFDDGRERLQAKILRGIEIDEPLEGDTPRRKDSQRRQAHEHRDDRIRRPSAPAHGRRLGGQLLRAPAIDPYRQRKSDGAEDKAVSRSCDKDHGRDESGGRNRNGAMKLQPSARIVSQRSVHRQKGEEARHKDGLVVAIGKKANGRADVGHLIEIERPARWTEHLHQPDKSADQPDCHHPFERSKSVFGAGRESEYQSRDGQHEAEQGVPCTDGRHRQRQPGQRNTCNFKCLDHYLPPRKRRPHSGGQRNDMRDGQQNHAPRQRHQRWRLAPRLGAIAIESINQQQRRQGA